MLPKIDIVYFRSCEGLYFNGQLVRVQTTLLARDVVYELQSWLDGKDYLPCNQHSRYDLDLDNNSVYCNYRTLKSVLEKP